MVSDLELAFTQEWHPLWESGRSWVLEPYQPRSGDRELLSPCFEVSQNWPCIGGFTAQEARSTYQLSWVLSLNQLTGSQSHKYTSLLVT